MSAGKLSVTEFLDELKRTKTGTPAPAAEVRSPEIIAPAPVAVVPDTPREPPPAAVAETNRGIKPPAQVAALFDRVNKILGPSDEAPGPFMPKLPKDLDDTGLGMEEIEKLILKLLLNKGSMAGRSIAEWVCLPFAIIEQQLKGLKQDQLVAFKGAAAVGDYEFTLTDMGRDRARRYLTELTYIGAAPVPFKQYLAAMAAQSIAKQNATEEDLKRSFGDLIINQKMFDKLGPAINSGRGMFLFGEPGNGKTSIAERITACFGSTIWIPRAIVIDGIVVRLFDPGVHNEVRQEQTSGILKQAAHDARWVQIKRPTVVAGGELTMEELEIRQNPVTLLCEAPLQLKSNCGTLVIDDFGRQRMPVSELLNRWIVPLEKRYDFLNLPNGKKVQVPFDQLIIFSTNLEPRDLVDGAFLRRIPYKIEVPDPSVEEFRRLFELFAPMLGFQYDSGPIEYLIETHYLKKNRPFRNCQPRDLLLQAKNHCSYKGLPKRLTNETFDAACDNYFSVM